MFIFKKKLIIIILYFITSCSSYNQNKEINIKLPNEINKINEKYIAYVQTNKWEVSKKTRLENCGNFSFNHNLENIHNKEVKRLLNEIFKDIDFYEYQLHSEEIKNLNYHGLISIFQNKGSSDLHINNKVANFKMNIQSKLVISNFEGKTFNSKIRANGFGSKELFFSCKVNNIIDNTLKETYEEFLNTIKYNIYKGISEINKNY
jgi:hypothetical protein